MTSWHEPRWSRPPPPQYEWSIDEIKGGVVLSTHRLDRPCTTFGRAADSVTIPTAHESCSRLHARIAFDSSGIPWCRDLGSGNGTTVNRKRLPAKSTGKTEDGRGEGSRGVVLYPGDMIQFGASTRMFCLVGPEEFDRGALAGKRAKEKAALEQAKAMDAITSKGAKMRAQNEDEGVTWGMDTTDYAEHNEEDVRIGSQVLEPLETMSIPEKYRKLYESFTAKKYKLDNLRRETERIQRKSVVSELSEGQRAQLERNQEKEECLAREVDEMEHDLKDKIAGRSMEDAASTLKFRKRDNEYARSYGEDDDDFFDRTIQSKKSKHESEKERAETEQSLTTKWKKLVSTLNYQSHHVIKSQRKVDELKTKMSSMEETDEDIFFIRNDLEIARDNAEKATKGKDEIQKELLDVEKMLRVVNDKLLLDRDIEFVGNKAALDQIKAAGSSTSQRDITKERTTMPSPLPSASVGAAAGDYSSRKTSMGDTMPPPHRKVPVGRALPSPEFSSKNENVAKAVCKAAMAPPPRSIPTSMAPPPKRSPRGPMLPPEGTLAAVISVTKADANKPKDSQSSKAHSTARVEKKEVPSASLAAHTFDPRKDEWRAPRGQDGSGMTKLNEKFAGRY